jgi:hypothetical protein
MMAVLRYKPYRYCHDLDKVLEKSAICCDFKCEYAAQCEILESTMREAVS